MKSPFKFLDAYQLKDRAVFFGRDDEIEALYDMAFETPLLLVHGLSGTGKTSLIQCGLASRFTGPDWLPFFIRRGTNFNASIQQTVLNALPPEVRSETNDIKDNIALLYSQFLRPVYLIMDQFEELFILGNTEEQLTLARSIRSILDAELSCKILIIMREEFMGQLYEMEQVIPSIYDFRLRLENMNYKKVKEVIGKSLENFCVTLNNPELDLNHIYAQISTGKSGIQLPYLQVYLDMLWREDFKNTYPTSQERDHWQTQMSKTPAVYPHLEFTAQEIEKFGNLQQVFALFLNEQEQLLQSQLQARFGPSIPAQSVRIILDLFVSEQGTKQPRPYQRKEGQILLEDINTAVLSKKLPPAALTYAIDHLCQNRLLRLEDNTLELAHDSLALLIEQERSDEQRRAHGLILRLKNAHFEYLESDGRNWPSPKLLLEAEDVVENLELDLEVLKFYQKSKKALEHKNKARRRKSLFIGLGIALITIIVSSVFIYISQHNQKVASLISKALLENNDAKAGLEAVQEAAVLQPNNWAAITAFNKIYSDNEFYLSSLVHAEQVKGVAIPPGAPPQWVYSWSHNAIYRWRWSGTLLDSIRIDNLITCQLSPNGKWLVYSDSDGYLTLLDAQNLQQLSRAQVSDRIVRQFTFGVNSQYLFYAENLDQDVYRINKVDISNLKKPLQSIRFQSDAEISAMGENPKTKMLWVGFANGRIAIYDPTLHLRRTETHHYDQVLSFAFFAPDGAAISVDRNGQMYFWNQALSIQAHDQRINRVVWADSSRIFTASKDYTIKSWSPLGKPYATYRGHKRFVSDIAVSADGQYFASASEDKMVRLWKTESKVITRFGPHQNGASAMFLFDDAKVIVTGSDQGENDIGELMNDPNIDVNLLMKRLLFNEPRSISIWNARNGKKMLELKQHNGGINALCKLGNTWASSGKDGIIYIWKGFQSNQPFLKLEGHERKVTQLAFSSDGKQLMSGGEDGQCILWQLQTGQKQVIPQGEAVMGIVYSPDGLWIVGVKNELWAYNRNGVKQFKLQANGIESIKSLALSPNGMYLLVGEWGIKAKIFDRKGNMLGETQLFSENKTGAQAINAVAFAPDGNTFCIGGEGGLARVYRLINDKPVPIRTLQHYPKKAILDLQFSADGKSLFSACNDGWVRQWDLMY